MGLNKCIFSGRLTRDPELTPVGDTKVVKFAIAMNRKFGQKEEVHFQDCEAWDSGADHIAKWYKKGDGIEVEGRMRTDSWEDKNGGGKRSRAVLRVEQSFFPPKGPEVNLPSAAEEVTEAKTTRSRAPEEAPAKKSRKKEVEADADIPF